MVATLIVYTNYILRNEDGTTRQESERHRVVVWGMHAEKAARLLRKGSKVRVQGRMMYPTWKDYQGANEEDDAQAEQVAVEVRAPQPAEPVAPVAEVAPVKPKRSRSKKAQAAAA